jgi:5'-nucleotidase
MRILLTNDDSIHGHGLLILEKIARILTDDVWVVASELDQSGAGHSLTLRDPLRIREVAPKKFAISGTPTDCVVVATSQILQDKKPDFIFSGVNYGANIADDITYSGTIAAAMEGTLLGIPSFAFSICIKHMSQAHWDTAVHHGCLMIEKLIKFQIPKNVLINVNFPDVDVDEVKGIKITSQGHRDLNDDLFECIDPRGKPYYWIGPGLHRYTPSESSLELGSDLDAVHNGYISITPISLNLTHTPSISQLKSLFPN